MGIRFTRLALRNWRNFKEVDVELADRVFVVGPNASGKSNLLDALRFLRDIASEGGGLSNALSAPGRGGLHSLRSLHATRVRDVSVEIHAEIEGQRWSYELALETDGTSKKPLPARIVRERVARDGQQLLNRPERSDLSDPELLCATALEQSSANLKFRALRDLLRSVDYIHVVPQLLRMPAQGDARRFGKGLGTGLIAEMGDVPKKERDARLRRIERGLRGVLPQFEKLEWFQDARGVPHVRAKYKHWRPRGAWHEESLFSDGSLRLIGLLWHLDQRGGPLLLEEPELSLHPAAVRQLPRILGRMSSVRGRQVIMTSHSPDLLADEGIEPSEVLLVRSTDKESQVVQGSAIPQLQHAARTGQPLSSFVEALTRPDGFAQLALFGTRP